MYPKTDFTLKILSFFLLFSIFLCVNAYAKDYYVTGKVTDESGRLVTGAVISMSAGNMQYKAISSYDGSYSLRISGIYDNVQGLLETSTPYPNPFSQHAYIPLIISVKGDVSLAVYSLSGRKITEIKFPSIEPGSYRLSWNGCNSNGVPVPQGLYIYAVSFRGETRSGRLIKISGETSAGSSSIEPILIPSQPDNTSGEFRLKVLTTVNCEKYYPVRLTDITIRRDTTIDFELAGSINLPFKTQGNHIARYMDPDYKNMVLKGINLGSSPPGFFPGEIAYAISAEQYDKWISQIAAAGFNCIRVYTLHPPVFYEKLANYNQRHADHPLLLFQGIWLDEVESPTPAALDLMLRTFAFNLNSAEVIDCIHGNKNIAFRPGKAYGKYQTDVSRWTAGYILGREISPQEVERTNFLHSSLSTYNGTYFSISGASAAEIFLTGILDEAVKYENDEYSVMRPVSASSWPTLDPLPHPTEVYTDEDRASIDLEKISGKNSHAGLFATYHAYPYYPNFVSEQSSYQAYSDPEGPDSYLGYLFDLKHHYADIPLVIGEFGVPSSWGSAHWSYSNMEHGGYSEKQQGQKNMRLVHNILDAGCAGGFMFSWMDEWFKRTWIVEYLEAFGFNPGTGIIPTRQLWQNVASPEQNFGLIGFRQTDVQPYAAFPLDNSSGRISSIKATNDNAFFYSDISFSGNLVPGDTVMIAFDTYSREKGESVLPNGKALTERSEFVLSFIIGDDHAVHYVTEAYDMNGLTPRFNLSDPSKQKYKSIISDGKPWIPMQWINDEYKRSVSGIGILPAENSRDFSSGERTALAWQGNLVRIRLPWTMLYYFDPSQMQVIDGAVSTDGGWTFSVTGTKSDGIGLSVYYKGNVVSTKARYNWDKWLVVPATVPYEKASLQLVEKGLSSISDFAN
jgi:hypothetical protein